MSFSLPVSGSDARDVMGDIAHVAEVLDPRNASKLPNSRDAVVSARKTVQGNPAVKSVNVICLRGDDERWLVSVGKRGGWKRIWNFGKGA